MNLWALLIFLALLASALPAAAPAKAVMAYAIEIQPDFNRKSFSAREVLKLSAGEEVALFFQTNDLTVDKVEVDFNPSAFTVKDGKITIPLTKSARELVINYHGTPTQGLIFARELVYTDFETCHWLLCDDSPSPKARVSITLRVPSGFAVVASGESSGRKDLAQNLTEYQWVENAAYSPYLYGFAAGRFTLASTKTAQGEFLFLSNDPADTPAVLRKKFADTSRMARFFANKAGVPLPHGAYTQVIVPGGIGQEKTSFSLLGAENLGAILAHPQEDRTIAHELAHQWWGNLVTCKTWADFWLNEGITVFMVAAYKEDRWGHPAYVKELRSIRRRYSQALKRDFDVPLTFAGEYPSPKLKRSIVYSKGALFMDNLRTTLGERAFWAGLKTYTQTNAGKSVTSLDLKAAMEASSHRDLTPEFKRWVRPD